MTTALGFKARVGGGYVSLLDLFFPVGSIYHSTKATDPSTFMGGTWRRLQNVFLYAAGSKAAGATGGEESHTLTVAEMPSHNHSGTTDEIKYGTNWNPGNDWSYSVASRAEFSQTRGLVINNAGGGSRTTTCPRTSSSTCGSAPRSSFGRWSAWLTCPSSNGATEVPFSSSARSRWEGSTSARPTSSRPPFGRERLGRASLRARSSCRAVALRRAITPSARPEALRRSSCRLTLYRNSICNRLRETTKAALTGGALHLNTAGSNGNHRSSCSTEETDRTRTGRPIFPSICGGAPHSLREEA